MPANTRVQGVVLAGGASTRMGASKSTVRLADRALIEYPIEALSAVVDTVVVAKQGTPLPALNVSVWEEPGEPSHPLTGIVTALERAGGRPLVVCACDMPFVTPELIEHLAGLDVALALPRAGGRLHPLLARYEVALLEQLREDLLAQCSLHEMIGALDPLVLSERDLTPFGEPERLLFNINTPEDLARAEAMVA